MDEDVGRKLSSLGKAMVQVNLRLAGLQERIEAQGPGGSGAAGVAVEREALFDLLQAVDDGLGGGDAGGGPLEPPAARATTWPWGRVRARREEAAWREGARAGAEALGVGLRMAAERARAALERAGIEPVPDAGPFDPACQRVVQRVTATDADTPGHVARVLQRGWRRRCGGEVLRLAQVAVFATGDEGGE